LLGAHALMGTGTLLAHALLGAQTLFGAHALLGTHALPAHAGSGTHSSLGTQALLGARSLLGSAVGLALLGCGIAGRHAGLTRIRWGAHRWVGNIRLALLSRGPRSVAARQVGLAVYRFSRGDWIEAGDVRGDALL
jgi:hypothetical protein